MNLCRCENGHFYDKEKYATCPHCAGGSAEDNSLTAAFTEDVTSAITQGSPMRGGVQKGETEEFDPSDALPVSDRFADEPTEAIYGQKFQVDTPTMPLHFSQTLREEPDDDDHTIGIYDDFFASPSPQGDYMGHRNQGFASPVTPAHKVSKSNKVSTPCVGWLVALSGAYIGTDFRLKTGKNFIGRGAQMDVALTEDKSVSRDRHAIVVYEPKAHLYLVQPGESSSLVYRNDEVVLTPVKLQAYDIITVGDVNLLFIPLCGKEFNWSQLFEQMKK